MSSKTEMSLFFCFSLCNFQSWKSYDKYISNATSLSTFICEPLSTFCGRLRSPKNQVQIKDRINSKVDSIMVETTQSSLALTPPSPQSTSSTEPSQHPPNGNPATPRTPSFPKPLSIPRPPQFLMARQNGGAPINHPGRVAAGLASPSPPSLKHYGFAPKSAFPGNQTSNAVKGTYQRIIINY